MSPRDWMLCAVFALALPLGQLLFKWAASLDGRLNGPFLMRAATNPVLVAAFAWYGLTALLWYHVLARAPLSTAYAFSLVGSCLVPLCAWLVFKEPMTWTMGLGYGLIIVGLGFVVGRFA